MISRLRVIESVYANLQSELSRIVHWVRHSRISFGVSKCWLFTHRANALPILSFFDETLPELHPFGQCFLTWIKEDALNPNTESHRPPSRLGRRLGHSHPDVAEDPELRSAYQLSEAEFSTHPLSSCGSSTTSVILLKASTSMTVTEEPLPLYRP